MLEELDPTVNFRPAPVNDMENQADQSQPQPKEQVKITQPLSTPNQQATTTPAPRPDENKITKLKSRLPIIIAAVVLVLAVLIGLLFVLGRSSTPQTENSEAETSQEVPTDQTPTPRPTSEAELMPRTN